MGVRLGFLRRQAIGHSLIKAITQVRKLLRQIPSGSRIAKPVVRFNIYANANEVGMRLKRNRGRRGFAVILAGCGKWDWAFDVLTGWTCSFPGSTNIDA